MLLPFVISESGKINASLPSGFSAISIIPCDSMPFIFLGAKLLTVSLPKKRPVLINITHKVFDSSSRREERGWLSVCTTS